MGSSLVRGIDQVLILVVGVPAFVANSAFL
jgi:hypothetical protein